MLVLASALSACAQERRYVGDGVQVVALTADTAPVLETEEAALYIVERRIDLPIRNPADSVLAALSPFAQHFIVLEFRSIGIATQAIDDSVAVRRTVYLP